MINIESTLDKLLATKYKTETIEFKEAMFGMNNELSKLNVEANTLANEIESNFKGLFGK